MSDPTDTGQGRQDDEAARGPAEDDTPEDGGLAAAVRPEVPAVSADATDATNGDDLAAAVQPDTGTELAEQSVDPELGRLFWKLVFLYKVTILGGTLGVLLVVFEPGPAIGPQLVGGAVVLLVYTLYLTRQTRQRIDAGEFHDDQSGTRTDDRGDPATGTRTDDRGDPATGTRTDDRGDPVTDTQTGTRSDPATDTQADDRGDPATDTQTGTRSDPATGGPQGGEP